ncbi:hypothetical protein AB0M47_35890 [Hamadaea sp. NPDC051192]|uniref:hypothetical protein n=1 Tax=Hamadaea sp. NPDC051192 TaxID=3154940 RepID=UPI00344733FE
MAKRWKTVGLVSVTLVVLAAAGITGRVLLLDDGPYLGVDDVCAALGSPDAKALIGTAESGDDPAADPSEHACRWRKSPTADWQLHASVWLVTATFWSGDGRDRAEDEYAGSRAAVERYDPWATDGHTVAAIPGLADEAYLLVSKRHVAKFVQWRMLLQARKANAELWVVLETDLYPDDVAKSDQERLLADFRAKAPAAISDLVAALH